MHIVRRTHSGIPIIKCARCKKEELHMARKFGDHYCYGCLNCRLETWETTPPTGVPAHPLGSRI